MRLIAPLLLLLLLMFAGAASAGTDYYVNNSWSGASDSNNGLANTNTSAWLTIQYAIETISAGDIIYVHGGTDYNEHLFINVTGSVSNLKLIGVNTPNVIYSGGRGVIEIGRYNIQGTLTDITVHGFNFTNTGDNSYNYVGVYVAYDSNVSYLNISNNIIHTEYGYGIYFHLATGNHSMINNNIIYTGIGDGIIFATQSGYSRVENITIYNNTVWACLDWISGTGSSGIRLATNDNRNTNFNVSYNHIYQSGYTGIKPNNINHSIISNNIIYADGYAHNAYEDLVKNTRFINNKVYGRNATWQGGAGASGNIFYAAGTSWQYNYSSVGFYANDTSWYGIHVGGHQSNVLIENTTLINHASTGITIFGIEEAAFPLKKYTSNNIVVRNATINLNAAGTRATKIVCLGTNTSTDHDDPSKYDRDIVTFIDINMSGTYLSQTWWLTNHVGGSSNDHFNGSVYIINSNKDDVYVEDYQEWYNGTIDFMYYTDIYVVDSSDNPISGATVTLTSNQTNDETGETICAKNINYSSAVKGHVDDITSVTTKSNGHTAKPDEDPAATIALTATTEDRYTKKGVQWSVNVTKAGYTHNDSVVIIPDSTWYLDILDVNVYQNTTKIVLSGSTPWSPSNTAAYFNNTAGYAIEITTKTDGTNIFSRTPTEADGNATSGRLVVKTT